MSSGWDRSADAWIASMDKRGDWTRLAVLDPAMLGRTALLAPGQALDVGCGEGRFCRLLQEQGMATIGIDPVEAFIRAAHRRDPAGEYRLGRAEELPFADASFDLVVSYLSLVDIEDLAAAVSEMVRVLAPSGRLLIANLASHNTAGRWIEDGQGRTSGYLIDDYLKQHPVRQRWAGIDIVNWHRPLSFYMRHFLAMGLMLTHFDEPAPEPGVDRTDGRFARAPWFVVMEWQKP